jgi:hypothetical protein
MIQHLLTKIMLLICILILIFTGTPLQIMQANILLPISNVAIAAASLEPTYSKTTIQSAQPTGILSNSLNEPEELSIPAQPMGNLTPIDWDHLDAVSIYPTQAQLLSFPSGIDNQPISVAVGQNISLSNNRLGLNISFTDEIIYADYIYTRYKSFGELGIRCNDCHRLMIFENAAAATLDHGHLLQLQIYSDPKIECKECHQQQTDYISLQLLGVE